MAIIKQSITFDSNSDVKTNIKQAELTIHHLQKSLSVLEEQQKENGGNKENNYILFDFGDLIEAIATEYKLDKSDLRDFMSDFQNSMEIMVNVD